MSMHVTSKEMAMLGTLAGLCVLFICLGSILESNTLFLLGAAPLCFGAALKDYGFRLGGGFLAATMALSLLLSGNKLYCLTYLGMCVYLMIRMFVFKGRMQRGIKEALCYAAFNIMYIPVIILAPKLVFHGTFNSLLFLFFIVGGQIVLFIYNYVLNWFLYTGWIQFKKRFLG